MFYIVETEEQLDKIISYGGNEKVFVEVIPVDDRLHPCINTPCLLYFRPLTAKRGFILAFDHTETFSLLYNTTLASLINKIPQIYTTEKKTLLHYGVKEEGLFGLKMAYKLNSNYPEFPDTSKYDTGAHKFYYKRLSSRSDVNRFIPVSKHYEKYEDLFESLIINEQDCALTEYTFYNDVVSTQFSKIERNGIKIDPVQFDKSFPNHQKRFSLRDDIIYSEYDFYNHTARPSCKFNGINFLALKKDDTRHSLVPQNDVFAEFDYKSYQVKILANLLDYHFEGDNIHEHLAELYGEADYEAAKKLTFQYLYGRSETPPDIPFFQEVYALRDFLWNQYQVQGYILSPNTGRKITGITEITQILPYLMQCLETEINTAVIFDLNQLLRAYKTKLVLYTYDAFLFDVSLEDDPVMMDRIKEILETANCKFTMNYGDSYGDLIQSL